MDRLIIIFISLTNDKEYFNQIISDYLLIGYCSWNFIAAIATLLILSLICNLFNRSDLCE